MNILLINLTRLGDLLQSAAALRALARNKLGETPRIGIVCLDNFVSGAELLPEVDAIYPLAAGQIMTALNGTLPLTTGKQCTAWLSGLASLHAWVAKVKNHFSPNVVCNISPTITACLLGRLLAGENKLAGFTLDASGSLQNTTPWATFMQASSASRSASPFNVVDLFRKIAVSNELGCDDAHSDGALLPAPESAVVAMKKRLAQNAPEGVAGYVALQLGANADIRRWPVASFASIGDALWEKHRLSPLLLGAKNEMHLAQEYAALANAPHIDLIGSTNITELAAAVCSTSLCISNDTGTLHLASGLGVPVLGIYLATAQAWDTGPYAPGNCSLEPDLPCHPCEFGTTCSQNNACHAAITPETAFQLASAKLTDGKWKTENFAHLAAYKGVRIWESTRDIYGFCDLVSLSGHEKDMRTTWLRVQRLAYRHFFDRKTNEPYHPDLPLNALRIAGSSGMLLARICDNAIFLFDALTLQAEMLAVNSIPLIHDRFQRTWDRLITTLRSHPDFAVIAFILQNETQKSRPENTLSLICQYHQLFRTIRKTLP